jgi:tRNA pseudouridine55 synthase
VTLDGVLVVDKPVGPTSHDVVATARRAFRLRRIGHTGTLDPNASGVLPLVLGSATRLAQHLTATDKEYDATVRFGVDTDSYDTAGRVVRESGQSPTDDALLTALDRFRGRFDQVPPAYSAKKVDGDRAYDRARKAQAITLVPVPVVVHRLDLISFKPPLAHLRLVCSAGFYVRSLAHDLGQIVGTGAVLDGLVRRRAGDFSLDDAVAFAELANGTAATLAPRVVPMERLLLHWPAVALTAEGVRRMSHGQELRPADWTGSAPDERASHVRLTSPEGRLLGIAEPSKTGGFLHPALVFPAPTGLPGGPP